MNKELSRKIKDITVELTEVRSVVGTSGEIDVENKAFEIMGRMEYFKANPENLYLIDCKEDDLKRTVVVAELQGKKSKSDKTIVLIGHLDTVGTSDYGPLEDIATKPYELAKRIGELQIGEGARRDLESGDFLFGRGIFDMKSGCAICMALVEEISKDIENFEGNIVFAGVCDEEGDSAGMLNFVPHLSKLKKEKGYDYLAMLDPDYCAPKYEGDKNKYVYIGTSGKIMPSFLIVGKETHGGESLGGLDPSQISSEIVQRVNGKTEFCDEAEGEVTVPPISLRQRDLKPEYSVQTATKSSLLFNYATYKRTPDQVLDQMKSVAQECFEQVITNFNKEHDKYCKMVGEKYDSPEWTPRTMLFSELCEIVEREQGEEYKELVKGKIAELNANDSIDVRDRTLGLVEYVHSLWSDKAPIIIVYITPPYYPHVFVDDEGREKDKNLIKAVDLAVKEIGENYEYNICQRKFLPCISDLSYASAPKDSEIITSLKTNIPGYGEFYSLPIEEMQELDLPVADIGTAGRDAHKFTERLELKYSFEVLPQIIRKTIDELLR